MNENFKKLIDQFSLENQIALVTGGAGHLGRVIARVLLEAGATVYISGRNEQSLLDVVENLKSISSRIYPAVFDVTSQVAISRFHDFFITKHSHLNILVNNAYTGSVGDMDKITSTDLMNAYQVSVCGAYDIISLFKPLLQKAAETFEKNASVINIASMYGTVCPEPELYEDHPQFYNPLSYGAAKAGLIQLTRYMACHLSCNGIIRVNSISPGPFPGKSTQKNYPDFCNKLAKKTFVNRIAQAEELAGIVLLLASKASSYITGANIPVDGGWTAK